MTDYLKEAKGTLEEYGNDKGTNEYVMISALIAIAEELQKLNTHLRKGQTCIVEQGEE